MPKEEHWSLVNRIECPWWQYRVIVVFCICCCFCGVRPFDFSFFSKKKSWAWRGRGGNLQINIGWTAQTKN